MRLHKSISRTKFTVIMFSWVILLQAACYLLLLELLSRKILNSIYIWSQILFPCLLSPGKVEMMTGVGKAMQPSLAQWENPNRPIAASGIFGHYMVTPANEALFVINGETRTVNCEIGGLVHPRAIVWVTMQLQWTETVQTRTESVHTWIIPVLPWKYHQTSNTYAVLWIETIVLKVAFYSSIFE